MKFLAATIVAAFVIAPTCSHAGDSKFLDIITRYEKGEKVTVQELEFIKAKIDQELSVLKGTQDVKSPTPTATEITMAIRLQGIGVLPPLEYDRVYEGELIVTVVGKESIAAMCPKTPFPVTLGCSRLGRPFGLGENTCQIIIANDDILHAAGYTYEIVYRHERGHCNGWVGDHRGSRAWAQP
jgi:hypothetical protein